jgi:hypothetical protein
MVNDKKNAVDVDRDGDRQKVIERQEDCFCELLLSGIVRDASFLCSHVCRLLCGELVRAWRVLRTTRLGPFFLSCGIVPQRTSEKATGWLYSEDSEFYALGFFDLSALAFAAAFDAFRALARLCAGVMVSIRAFPPLRPISAKYFETGDLAMKQNYNTEAASMKRGLLLTAEAASVDYCERKHKSSGPELTPERQIPALTNTTAQRRGDPC